MKDRSHLRAVEEPKRNPTQKVTIDAKYIAITAAISAVAGAGAIALGQGLWSWIHGMLTDRKQRQAEEQHALGPAAQNPMFSATPWMLPMAANSPLQLQPLPQTQIPQAQAQQPDWAWLQQYVQHNEARVQELLTRLPARNLPPLRRRRQEENFEPEPDYDEETG